MPKEFYSEMEKKNQISFIPVPDLPLIKAGDNLASEIYKSILKASLEIEDGDIFVVAQKIVSKAEKREVQLDTITPSKEAIELSKVSGKPASLCQVILNESRKIIKVEPGIIVTEHRLGYISTSAGIDRSNTGSTSGDIALLLPKDPDKSASGIRIKLQQLLNKEISVIVSDSGGRADRLGSRGEAIGVAGIPALLREDKVDIFGRPLHTEIALADSVAALANLIMGESDEHCPVIVARGIKYTIDEEASIQTILKKGDSVFQ